MKSFTLILLAVLRYLSASAQTCSWIDGEETGYNLNPSGTPLWVKYSEDVTCILPKVRVDKDNNIYWTGQLNNSCSFDTITLQGPSWVYDFHLVKMTPQGSALWGREVPQVITGDATVGPLDIIKVLQDNSVTIGGDARDVLRKSLACRWLLRCARNDNA